jgi:signal transduction histidine kinase
VTLVARALGLERVALLVEDSTAGALVPVATYGNTQVSPVRPGEQPGDGPWSHTLPMHAAGHLTGLLLLGPAGGGELSASDLALAERLAEAAAGIVRHADVAAELARAREQLARADRLAALGTLAAAVAHDIRNPLVSVQTFIQLLPERLHDDEFRTTFRDLALNEIERICTLINDLLAFSRPAPTAREPADLGELVRQIARLLEVEARKHDVTVTCGGDPVLPPVAVDSGQVKQVLLNVILNAIQASAPGRAVEVTTRVLRDGGGGWCVVSVADTGPGIAPEHRDEIFDPFFTTKDAGSGLGLYIAQTIVREHGGYIAAGPRDGGGTLFSIHFPLGERREGLDAGPL